MVDISIKNLSFTYAGSNIKTLDNISLDIKRGEFVIIAGKSGSGKSTLLRMMKPELSPNGKTEGEILFFGKNKNEYALKDSASDIGFVLQNTEYQTLTHSVRTELAFGAQNIGLRSESIRLRMAELSAYFSLNGIIDKKIDELSGGQKQLVCLASILMMHPEILIFDEPASMLDPMTAENLFLTINKLCRENGMTVIMTEHRLQSVIPYADRLVVLDNGKIISDSCPSDLSKALFNKNEYIHFAMPTPMRLCAALDLSDTLPLDTGSCRRLLIEKFPSSPVFTGITDESENENRNTALEAKHISFAYDKSGYVLKDFSLKIPEGSFFAILGANAAGKSTALSLMAGLLPCKIGKISVFGKSIKKYRAGELYNGVLAVLPQNCESLFSGNTVREDLFSALSDSGLSGKEKEEKLIKAAESAEILHILDRHPYDISGGEMQRAALSIVLLKDPKIILMDEPTKGMDPVFKVRFAHMIKKLCRNGKTVICVSHDTEFCAEFCDRCALISDGMCVSEEKCRSFFSKNYFYTTAANKTARDIFPDAVTEREVIDLCRKNLQN